MIDADASLCDSIKENRFFIYKVDALNNVFVINTAYDYLKKALDNKPTIDAVEVVRCKDCKHTIRSKVSPEKITCCLTKMCGTVDPDFFCADGERKMDVEVENEQS